MKGFRATVGAAIEQGSVIRVNGPNPQAGRRGEPPRESGGIRAPSDPGDVAFVLGLLRRQRNLILKVMAGALAVGALVLLLAPSTYKATAVVLIDFKRLSAVDENFSTETGRIDSSAVLSQIELLKSEGVISRIVVAEKLDEDPEFLGSGGLLTKLGLATDPKTASVDERRRLAAETVKKSITAERVDLSYAIAVTFAARSGATAAHLANTMAQAYIDDQLDAKRVASEKASAWFGERIAELQRDVSNADRAVIGFRLKNNIVTNDGKFIDEQQISDFSEKLLQASFTRASAEAKIAQADELLRVGAPQSTLVDELSNEVIIKLRNAYLESQRQAADLSIRYGATHESVIKERAKMAELQKSMIDEVRRIQEGARSDFLIAQALEKTLRQELGELSNRAIGAREAHVQLAQLESASDTVKTIRDTFMSRYVDGIQKQSFPMTEARVISAASAPTNPSFPTPAKTLGGGALLGFGLGCLLAIGREAFSRRIRLKRQVEDVTGAPCLGFLPMVRGGDQPIALHSEGLSKALGGLYVETMRSTKVSIDLRGGGECVVLGVISAVLGEGKSTTASNFAQLCAASGARTLLIDANFRNPSLSNALCSTRESGLLDVVEGRATISSALKATSDGKLHLLANSGSVRAKNPGGVLSSEATRTLLQGLRKQFDYIVLDLPALAVVADARAVASLVDTFLLVIEWDAVPSHIVDEALRQNPQVRDKIVGSLLNKANLKTLMLLDEPSAKHSAAYAV